MSNPFEYMRAAVRLATGRPCADWTDDEIIASFGLLRRPVVTYSEWVAAVSPGEPGTPGVQGTGADPGEPTEQEMIETNERNLAAFQAAFKEGQD